MRGALLFAVLGVGCQWPREPAGTSRDDPPPEPAHECDGDDRGFPVEPREALFGATLSGQFGEAPAFECAAPRATSYDGLGAIVAANRPEDWKAGFMLHNMASLEPGDVFEGSYGDFSMYGCTGPYEGDWTWEGDPEEMTATVSEGSGDDQLRIDVEARFGGSIVRSSFEGTRTQLEFWSI